MQELRGWPPRVEARRRDAPGPRAPAARPPLARPGACRVARATPMFSERHDFDRTRLARPPRPPPMNPPERFEIGTPALARPSVSAPVSAAPAEPVARARAGDIYLLAL